MEVKTESSLKIEINFTNAEAEQLKSLAAREGISTDALIQRALDAFFGFAAREERADEMDWQALGLAAFERDWDNPEDAIYDNWRELYGVEPR